MCIVEIHNKDIISFPNFPEGPDLPGGPGDHKHQAATDSHHDTTFGSFFR